MHLIFIIVIDIFLWIGIPIFIALVMAVVIPRGFYSYQLPFYHTFLWEQKFYKVIDVQSWKDKLPEIKSIGGISQKNLPIAFSIETVDLLLVECCKAEAIHVMSIIVWGILLVLTFLLPYHMGPKWIFVAIFFD